MGCNGPHRPQPRGHTSLGKGGSQGPAPASALGALTAAHGQGVSPRPPSDPPVSGGEEGIHPPRPESERPRGSPFSLWERLSCLSPQILKCALITPLGGAFIGGGHLAVSLGAEADRVSLRVGGSDPGTESPAGSPTKALQPAPQPPGQQDSHGFCPPGASFLAGQKGVNGFLLSFQTCSPLHVTWGTETKTLCSQRTWRAQRGEWSRKRCCSARRRHGHWESAVWTALEHIPPARELHTVGSGLKDAEGDHGHLC